MLNSLCPYFVCPAWLGGSVNEPAITLPLQDPPISSWLVFLLLSQPSLCWYISFPFTVRAVKSNVFILLYLSVLLKLAAGRHWVMGCIPPGVSQQTAWTSSSSGAKRQLVFPLPQPLSNSNIVSRTALNTTDVAFTCLSFYSTDENFPEKHDCSWYF